MDFLPKELFHQIMYYLSIEDINTLEGLYPRISESEYFWNEYLSGNQIAYIRRDSIKGYHQNFAIMNNFNRSTRFPNVITKETMKFFNEYDQGKEVEKFCNYDAFLNMPSTLIDKVKIGALYSIIDNIDPGNYDLIFVFEKNVLKVCIGNPLNHMYITYSNGLKAENRDFNRKYLSLLEDKTFKKYGIDLSVERLILDIYKVTRKDIELILWIIKVYRD